MKMGEEAVVKSWADSRVAWRTLPNKSHTLAQWVISTMHLGLAPRNPVPVVKTTRDMTLKAVRVLLVATLVVYYGRAKPGITSCTTYP